MESKVTKVLIGELPINQDGYALSPEAGTLIHAQDYVALYPDVYRIEERVGDLNSSLLTAAQ